MYVCVCVYVYIFIYIYVCVCVCVCVLWVVVGIIFNIFEAVSDCLEGLPLSVYFGAKTTQKAEPAWICAKLRNWK